MRVHSTPSKYPVLGVCTGEYLTCRRCTDSENGFAQRTSYLKPRIPPRDIPGPRRATDRKVAATTPTQFPTAGSSICSPHPSVQASDGSFGSTTICCYDTHTPPTIPTKDGIRIRVHLVLTAAANHNLAIENGTLSIHLHGTGVEVQPRTTTGPFSSGTT